MHRLHRLLQYESLEKLHEHYHIAEEDITKSVQILTKKAQLKKGYGEFES